MKIQHPYEGEFEEVMTAYSFFTWAFSNLRAFMVNMMKFNNKPQPVREWITMFLLWCEYSDYMDWLADIKKRGVEDADSGS